MRTHIAIGTQVFYNNCIAAFQWTGSLRDVPDLILDLIDEGLASVGKPYRTLTIGPINGYRTADPGDVVIVSENSIHRYHFDIIRNCEKHEVSPAD